MTTKILDRLKSRKFWLTFGGAAAVLFAKKLGFDVSEDQFWQFVTIVTGYNLAEAHIDAKRVALSAQAG